MCVSDPPLEVPMCVDACTFDALTYKEREVELDQEEEQVKSDEMETAYDLLVKKFGKKKVMDTFARLSRG
jgi:benzoyl-CoA reductase subunit BamC